MLTIKRHIVLIAALILISACTATEQELLIKLKENPNNTRAMGKLGEIYYYQHRYQDALNLFQKLEVKKTLNDTQVYMKNVIQIKIKTNNTQLNWKNILPLRRTKAVVFHRITNNKILKLKIPDHWIMIHNEFKHSLSFLERLDLSYNYHFSTNQLLSHEDLFDMGDNKGIIYCGPEFIMRYSFSKPKPSKFMNEPEKIDNLELIMRKTMKKLKKKGKKIKNLEGYVFLYKMRNTKTGRIIVQKKVKFKDGMYIPEEEQSAAYITYLQIHKLIKPERTKNNKERKKVKIRHVRMMLRAANGTSMVTINTHFRKKYTDIYMREINRFLRNADLL